MNMLGVDAFFWGPPRSFQVQVEAQPIINHPQGEKWLIKMNFKGEEDLINLIFIWNSF